MAGLPQKDDEQYGISGTAQGQKYMACWESQVRQMRGWAYEHEQPQRKFLFSL